MTDWLTFDGVASKQGNVYLLTAKDGPGAIELPVDAVQIEGDNIRVALGANARIIEIPPTGKGEDEPKIESSKEFSTFGPEECPNRRWYCFLLVAFCCESGKIIGPCIGIGGCY